MRAPGFTPLSARLTVLSPPASQRFPASAFAGRPPRRRPRRGQAAADGVGTPFPSLSPVPPPRHFYPPPPPKISTPHRAGTASLPVTRRRRRLDKHAREKVRMVLRHDVKAWFTRVSMISVHYRQRNPIGPSMRLCKRQLDGGYRRKPRWSCPWWQRGRQCV